MNQVPPRLCRYSPADLQPPGGGSLSDFFPVYLGNFWCVQPDLLVRRVQEYFASRGLLVRMVFLRDAVNDSFRNLQDENKLYDCLVYFVRPEDAEDACRFLHRELYYGHRVNLFPGRVPVFFDCARAIKYNIINHSNVITEQVLEKDLTSKAGARVECIVKHAVRDIFVELSDPDNMQTVSAGYWFCTPDRVNQNQPKQRFLEQDVQGEIDASLPQLMAQMPTEQILTALYNGINPQVLPPDCHENRVRKVDMRNKGRKNARTFKHRQVAAAIAQNFGTRASFADQLRPGSEVVAQRALRKVEEKARAKGMNMAQWWSLFPDAQQIYLQTVAADPRERIPYVRYRTPPQSNAEPYTYDDLFNLGLKYIAHVRPKHRY